MDAVLTPRGGAPTGTSAWTAGFAHAARLIDAALGAGPAVSRRTELFRALPAEPMRWLLTTFPSYFQNSAGEPVPLAAHHEALWRWLWALRPGVWQRPLIGILGRGGGKSTSTELGAAVVGYFGLRRYALYVSDTAKQADDHVATVASLFEGLGIERAINRYGFSRGWSVNRLRTADGFTLDAIGMDVAIRGVRFEEFRPDLVILDDLDQQADTRDTIDKKIDILTRSILPAGSADLAVIGVQNLPNSDGIFAQLVDGRAEFLMEREVLGPFPVLRDVPEQDWYTAEVAPDGTRRWRILAGEPVWAGQNLAACETLLNRMGPRGFEIECLHRIAQLGGQILQREWFRIVDDWPRGASLVRYWDFAATDEPGPRARGKAADPDWTVGVLMAMWRGQFWVVDVQRVRATPFGVETLVTQTARLDGPQVEIWLEEEGGSSGKSVTAAYRQNVLVGYTVRIWHTTGSKGERAKPFASAAEAGNVFLVRAPWNSAYLDELHHFGQRGWHDDQADASVGAHYGLTLGQTLLPPDLSLAPVLEGMTQAGLDSRAQHAALLPQVAQLWGVDLEDVA